MSISHHSVYDDVENAQKTTRATDASIRDLVKRYINDGLGAGLGHINDWDVSAVTNMAGLFRDAATFNDRIDKWDVSKVTNMRFMFSGATSFNQPIGNWDVSLVREMPFMFFGATSFNQPIGNWDVSSVGDMAFMFFDATAFDQPVDDWDVSAAKSTVKMFFGASAFNRPLNSWGKRLVKDVVDMREMFQGATRFRQPLPDWALTADEEKAMGISHLPMQLAALDQQRMQNQADDKGPSRISLMIFAHGADLTLKKRLTGKNKFFEFALDTEAITILNCGTGQCGLISWYDAGSDELQSDAIQLATRPHHPETFKTMQQVQQIVKPMYATMQQHLTEDIGKGEKEAVEKDLHGKMYHPHLDRMYTEEPQKFVSMIKIVQVFGGRYDGLVGRELIDPVVIDTFRDFQPRDAAAITEFASHFTGEDEYEVKLSEIVAFCKVLGFQYVNVYESSCRVLNHANRPYARVSSVKIANKVNAIEGVSSARETMGFGGGGKATTTPRHRNNKNKKKVASKGGRRTKKHGVRYAATRRKRRT